MATHDASDRVCKMNSAKAPFDIEVVFDRIREAVQPFARAALFELRDEGFTSAFEQLVACIISIRTYDETMIKAARRLFKAARTPQEVLALTPQQIDALITPSTFHENKAVQIHDIARRIVDEFNGELLCDYAVLTSLRGVGPKCANLVLGVACKEARIGVDVHVHRVTNRWKPFNSKSPEQTIKILEEWLPKQYWVEINELLVPFGKHICTGTRPKCSTCPVLDMCLQVGVVNPR